MVKYPELIRQIVGEEVLKPILPMPSDQEILEKLTDPYNNYLWFADHRITYDHVNAVIARRLLEVSPGD